MRYNGREKGARGVHLVKAKGILTSKNGLTGMNVYRGCTHGCIYCDSRSTCYGFTHPFEDVAVKENAPELLEQALRSRRKRCVIGTGAMSDPYQPLEEELNLTRRCLEIIDKYGFGVALQTKSARVLRDLDRFRSINEKAKCVVQMTLTTYDEELCQVVEPHVSTTAERLAALRTLRDNGIPTVVWLTPILPFINDTEENLRGLLEGCAEAGVAGIVAFGMGLTLRDGDREYYYAALDRHFPGLKERYIRTYGNAYMLPSPNEEKLMGILRWFCAERGILCEPEEVFAWMNELPSPWEQTSLF